MRGNQVDLATEEILIYISSNSWVNTLLIKMEKMYLYIYREYVLTSMRPKKNGNSLNRDVKHKMRFPASKLKKHMYLNYGKLTIDYSSLFPSENVKYRVIQK